MTDSEYEEDEELILVNLNSLIDAELLDSATFKDFKAIGLDMDEPLMLVENYLFTGKCEDICGTACFFETSGEAPKPEDPVFSHTSVPPVKFICKSDKVYQMSPAFMTKKSEHITADKGGKENNSEHSLNFTASIKKQTDES